MTTKPNVLMHGHGLRHSEGRKIAIECAQCGERLLDDIYELDSWMIGLGWADVSWQERSRWNTSVILSQLSPAMYCSMWRSDQEWSKKRFRCCRHDPLLALAHRADHLLAHRSRGRCRRSHLRIDHCGLLADRVLDQGDNRSRGARANGPDGLGQQAQPTLCMTQRAAVPRLQMRQ
jgi:hypothetical protein